jgi:hypothetical protein
MVFHLGTFVNSLFVSIFIYCKSYKHLFDCSLILSDILDNFQLF